MLKGNVNEPMAVGKQVTLKNTIKLCCRYNKIKIEIRDKATGKILVSTGSPMPVEPARARVQVTDATYRLSPKPVGAVVTYKNHASMPILVKAILYRKGPGSPNSFTKVDERKIHFYPNQTKGIFYGQKAGTPMDGGRPQFHTLLPGIVGKNDAGPTHRMTVRHSRTRVG